MKTKILSLANEEVGEISLNEDIFAVEFIRDDIVKQVIDWQRAKAMSGNHKTKTVSEVLGTTKKLLNKKVQVMQDKAPLDRYRCVVVV